MGDNTIDYDALEARLTDPDYPLRSAGQVRTGEAAATVGYEFLLREYGSPEAIAEQLHPGRPHVGALRKGPSPSVRGRLAPSDYEAFRDLMKETGRSQSDLVREAVHDLITRYRAAS